MRLKLISCEIFFREMSLAASRSPNQVDIEFLPKGLHDIGAGGMRARLQETIDAVETKRYKAILLGYGLCNYGAAGLRAPAIPLVIPRAHDCIALFFGSRKRYWEYFESQSGVYFKTTGWMERDKAEGELRQLSIQSRSGMNLTLEELTSKYGEDNAHYLYNLLHDPTPHYRKIAYIEMGLEPDSLFAQRAREEAGRRGWGFEKVPGDISLIQRLLDGPWPEDDFLTVEPGAKTAVDYGEGVINAVQGTG